MKRFLALVLVLVFASPAVAQIPLGAAAITYCNDAGQAESAFKHTVLSDSVWLTAVIAHEAKHREQISRYPTCEIAQMFYAMSPHVRLDQEAEAYCTGFHAAMRAGGRRDDYLEYTIRAMERAFMWFGFSQYDIAMALHKHGCFRS